jgi:hypothetical protein
VLEAPLPILGVSYGGNDPVTAEFPLDWGTEVPLEFMQPQRVLVVSPSRDRPLEEHLQLGQVLAGNRLLQGKRVALIASADHGHAHDPDGPYGFDPAAAEYDALLQEILAFGRLDFLRSPSSSSRRRRTRSGSSSSCRAPSARQLVPFVLAYARRRTTGCSWPKFRRRRRRATLPGRP